MVDPIDGTPIAADEPEAGVDATPASVADPGEESEFEPEEDDDEDSEGEDSEDEEEEEPEVHEIRIKLVDSEGNGVPGKAYELTLPSGVRRGPLDNEGCATEGNIPDAEDGEVCFTGIHADEWEPQ